MNKFYLAITFLVISYTGVNAQNVLADGNKYYAEGNYFQAATCYEKVLGANKANLDKVQVNTPYGHKHLVGKKPVVATTVYNRDEVIYKLAESYRLYNNFEKAEPFYKKSVDSSKISFPLNKFWYAVCLRANKKYKESETYFNQFLSTYKSDDLYKKSAQRELDNLKSVVKLTSRKDSASYTVRKLDTATINLVGATSSPSLSLAKQTFYFTSSRLDSVDLVGLGKKHPAVYNHIYAAAYNKGKIENPVRVSFANDTFNMHKGASSVTPDGKKMFFEIQQLVKGKKKYYICVSEFKNNVWSEPKKLGKTINIAGYNAKQPFVTSDGKYLLYSSDRPGGQGGFDLWYTQLGRDAYVLDAFNLGDIVNTVSDDEAPFYHNSTNTLVFSSNGRVGMGGFDLYRSHGTIGGNWSAPTNLGYPTNSSKDELDFASQENAPLLENAFFSSDKGDVCCPQIYNLHKEIVAKTFAGVVLDSLTNEPLANAKVSIFDSESGKQLYSLNTTESGNYLFKTKEVSSLNLYASKEGYRNDQANFKGMSHLEELDADVFELPSLHIAKIRTPKPDIIVYFGFDSTSLTDIGKLQLDSMVDRLKADSTLTIEIQGNTDGKGNHDYNVRLGRNRSQTCYDYFIKAGIPDKNLFIVTFGMDRPADKNNLEDGTDNPEGRKRNRRVEFRILKSASF